MKVESLAVGLLISISLLEAFLNSNRISVRHSLQCQASLSEIKENFRQIKENIQQAPGKISNNVKRVSDSIVYFPSNVTASVELTRSNLQDSKSNIDGQIDNVKKTIVSLSPVPFIKATVVFFKLVIDTGYDLREGKIGGDQIFARFKKEEKVVAVKAFKEKTSSETYEDAKESLYSTIDNVQAFWQGFLRLVEKVKQLPSDVINTQKSFVNTRESLALTSDIFQKDLKIKQLESQEFGKVVWKIVSLEAAKETYVDLKEKYISTAKYVDEVQANPKLIFSGSVKAKVEDIKTVAPIQVVKDETPLGKVWGVLKATKGGVDGTISAVIGVTKGVQGLQKRIDKKLTEQRVASSNAVKKIELKQEIPPSSSISAVESAVAPIETTDTTTLETAAITAIDTTDTTAVETTVATAIETTTAISIETTTTATPVETTTTAIPIETTAATPIETTTATPVETTAAITVETTTATPVISPPVVLVSEIVQTADIPEVSVIPPVTPVVEPLQDLEQDIFTTAITKENVVELPIKKNYSPYRKSVDNSVGESLSISPPSESA